MWGSVWNNGCKYWYLTTEYYSQGRLGIFTEILDISCSLFEGIVSMCLSIADGLIRLQVNLAKRSRLIGCGKYINKETVISLTLLKVLPAALL